MKLFSKRNAVVSGLGAVMLFGAAILTNAQDVNQQYRQYQRAVREAQRVCMDYQRSGSRSDYRQCQEAQLRAQQELADYQRASRGYSSRYSNNGYYNNGYYNSGSYNSGATTVYNPRTGQYYRVYNNGRYYNTDQRGMNLLRQAINAGYQQGYRQGQMDRRYSRGYDYYGNNVYSNGTYGYQSYVARDQYQYYFQQGFQRGYEDGYNSTSRYGYRSGSSFNILSGVLNTILNLASQ